MHKQIVGIHACTQIAWITLNYSIICTIVAFEEVFVTFIKMFYCCFFKCVFLFSTHFLFGWVNIWITFEINSLFDFMECSWRCFFTDDLVFSTHELSMFEIVCKFLRKRCLIHFHKFHCNTVLPSRFFFILVNLSGLMGQSKQSAELVIFGVFIYFV